MKCFICKINSEKEICNFCLMELKREYPYKEDFKKAVKRIKEEEEWKSQK